MRIVVIGLGHLGLVTSACLSDLGHQVICVDSSDRLSFALQGDESPAPEPGLKHLIERNFSAGRLFSSSSVDEAVAGSELIFVTVETSIAEDGGTDMTEFDNALHRVAATISDHAIVVVKSTVPVGTGDRIEQILRSDFPKKKISIVSNPDLVRPGSAIADFKAPDRIVIGSDDPEAISVMRGLYFPFLATGDNLLVCDRKSSELIRYVADAFQLVKVGFIHEIAEFCEKADADFRKVARGIGFSARSAQDILGTELDCLNDCFSHVSTALLRAARDVRTPLSLVDASIAVQSRGTLQIAHKIIRACGGAVRDKKIALFGVCCNLRCGVVGEERVSTVIKILADHGAILYAYDPQAPVGGFQMIDDVFFGNDLYSVASSSDAIVVIADWEQSRALDFVQLRAIVATPTFIDLLNAYEGAKVAHAGFSYFGVGVKAAILPETLGH